MGLIPLLLTLLFVFSALATSIPPARKASVYIQKCCKVNEIFVDKECTPVNETSETPWTPTFLNAEGQVVHPNFNILSDKPACGNRLPSFVYHKDLDRLILLPDGTLRHYIITPTENEEILDEDLTEEMLHYDYKLGYYCQEKKIDKVTGKIFQFAILCPPKLSKSWTDTDFLLRRIIDPTFHIIGIICYLTGAIVHFVLPLLRDMVGNIITTLCVCMVIAQAADTCRIFTEFTSPVGFLIADIVMFISLVAAYFWLNALGFYIWKTFRSHNVFLRMTDGRKYCIYSYWVWSWTAIMSILAVFCHYAFDEGSSDKPNTPIAQGTALGWLGVGVFFSPIACTILGNIYFYLSTLQVIGSVSRYGGRIHHKLKYCFKTFLRIFLIMTISWLFLLLSWLPYPSMYYCYIFVNALEAPLILYVSVLSQRRVRFLLRQECCLEKCICHCCRPNQPNDMPEWGEEMMAMNR